MDKKKILICGGGTAGHVYPAMALIEEIKRSSPRVSVLFVGTKKGMENKFIPLMGIRFEAIRAAGLSAADNIFEKVKVYGRFVFFLAGGFFTSIKLILGFKPDVILGMGGYVCGPVLLAAVFLRKNFMLHEQNYIPGRLNRFFSRFAKKVFISFEGTRNYLKTKRVVYSGNPVRASVREFKNEKKDYSRWGLARDRFTVVAFGGSLGAGKLNDIMVDIYSHFRDNEKLQILLITGNRFYRQFEQIKNKAAKDEDKIILQVIPYTQHMAQIYRVADLIISRAGANTIAELAITDIPAILIPYPYAIDNHQYYNAKYLADNGRAILIQDKDLSSELLIDNICGLIEHNKRNYNNLLSREVRLKKMDSEKIIIENLLGS
ncbi:MAG: undecaprenyldiphospho-muramoylpentapeptide beta-N-acetylglucosaminyltransferase [Actinomycetota bacterium]